MRTYETADLIEEIMDINHNLRNLNQEIRDLRLSIEMILNTRR